MKICPPRRGEDLSDMTKDERIKYWLNTATQDWKVTGHLFEKGGLFVCFVFLSFGLGENIEGYLCQKAG